MNGIQYERKGSKGSWARGTSRRCASQGRSGKGAGVKLVFGVMAAMAVAASPTIPWVHVVTAPVSNAEPSQNDMKFNNSLIQEMLSENLIPTEDESAARVKVLGKLNELVAAFVKQAFEQNGQGDQYNDITSFRLRTFGSYRLDVHLPGADMDTVMVVPKHVHRGDMFTILYVTMAARKDIKNLIKVEEARVPVIKFEMDGFEFDLAMARFANLTQLPEDFDVTDDNYLKYVESNDPQSITSLNGMLRAGLLSFPGYRMDMLA